MWTNTTEDDCTCICIGHGGRDFKKLILHQLMKFKDFFFLSVTDKGSLHFSTGISRKIGWGRSRERGGRW